MNFDSIQYHIFLQSQDFLNSGVTIKRFPFSTFFNDSSPNFLERCQDIFDSNGDPIYCDQVQISYASGGGGGSSGGSNSVTISQGSGGGSGPVMCSWSISIMCGGDPRRCLNIPVVTIVCPPTSNMRKGTFPDLSLITCMDCSISDFGSPAFTLARDATNIDNLLGGNTLSDWHMAYLSHNTAFSFSLRTALQNDTNLDKNAALFTISAGMNGAFFGNFNDSFILSVEGLMADSEVDLIEDPIPLFFQSYFDGRYAILKVLNPSWSPEKLFYESAKEAIHLVLDGIGLIEGLGTPADLLNAGLYYLEGNRVMEI